MRREGVPDRPPNLFVQGLAASAMAVARRSGGEVRKGARPSGAGWTDGSEVTAWVLAPSRDVQARGVYGPHLG
jgi:hypothetical protein